MCMLNLLPHYVGSAGTIVSAEIEDCELPPCVITRPNNKDVNITFTPGKSYLRDFAS